MSLTALATVLGLIRLRRLFPEVPRPYRTLGYPATPLVFIAGNLWIVWHTVASRPLVVFCGIATIAAGGALHSLLLGKGERRRRLSYFLSMSKNH